MFSHKVLKKLDNILKDFSEIGCFNLMLLQSFQTHCFRDTNSPIISSRKRERFSFISISSLVTISGLFTMNMIVLATIRLERSKARVSIPWKHNNLVKLFYFICCPLKCFLCGLCNRFMIGAACKLNACSRINIIA